VFLFLLFEVGMTAHPLETKQQTEEAGEHEAGRNISSPDVSSVIFSV